jgi:hypothetical protein
MSQPTKQGKKRARRHPNRPRSKQRYYFTQETENSIIEWQEETEPRRREWIYTKNIHEPFQEIAASLINVYHLADAEERAEVIADCVSMLYEALGKFDHTKGFKAFAYFSVISRNWLISRRKLQRKDGMKFVSYDSVNLSSEDSALSTRDVEFIHENSILPSFEQATKHEMFPEVVNELWVFLDEHIDANADMGDDEKAVIEACRAICNQAETLDLQTRAAIRLYIEEYTGLSKKKLSKAIKNLRSAYKHERAWVPGLAEQWEET